MVQIHELLIGYTENLEISWELAIEYKDLAEKSGDDYHLGNAYGHLGLFKLDLAEFGKARESIPFSFESCGPRVSGAAHRKHLRFVDPAKQSHCRPACRSDGPRRPWSRAG